MEGGYENKGIRVFESNGVGLFLSFVLFLIEIF